MGDKHKVKGVCLERRSFVLCFDVFEFSRPEGAVFVTKGRGFP